MALTKTTVAVCDDAVDQARTLLSAKTKIERGPRLNRFIIHAGGFILCRVTYRFDSDNRFLDVVNEVDGDVLDTLTAPG